MVGSGDPDLSKALLTLDARTRTALLLNVVDGYTQAEIGQMLGVPVGTVASWLSRGRAALRHRLGADVGRSDVGHTDVSKSMERPGPPREGAIARPTVR